MSLESATCPGCDHSFSLRGYQSHLALSRDPLCRAVFEKLKKADDAYELLMSAEEDSDTDAVPFQGDAFGTAEDYASDTFGQSMDDNEVDADDPPPLMMESDDEDIKDEDDLEMANMVAELEKSWEPHREGAPRQEAMVDSDEVDANDPPPLMEVSDNEGNDEEGTRTPHQALGVDIVDDETHIQLERNVNRFIIGDGYGVKPAVRIRYNDKYSSARAGQPLTHEESRDHAYGAALGGGDNPWAPFNSKKDWEIARWAKLRGAGSTAFSELLEIDGVCFN
jgi:hypothetical protein